MQLLSVEILDLYKKKLLMLPDVKFVWSFAMRGKKDMLNYHLVFATKHPLGMEKMKEAMKVIDQDGSYTFSQPFHEDQHVLFRADDAEVYAEGLFNRFNGKSASWEDVRDYALCETPCLNPKAMLAVIEKQGRLKVVTVNDQPRRAGTFPDDKVRELRFGPVPDRPMSRSNFFNAR